MSSSSSGVSLSIVQASRSEDRVQFYKYNDRIPVNVFRSIIVVFNIHKACTFHLLSTVRACDYIQAMQVLRFRPRERVHSLFWLFAPVVL